MKLRIKSMIWNIRKQKTINQNSKKKRESKKNKNSVGTSVTTSSVPAFASQGCQKNRKNRKLEIYLKN